MSQDESSPLASPPGPRFSRDTMLLVGALAFLIVALALTFVFTPSLGPQTGPLAQTASASALAAASTQAGSPTPGASAVASYPVPTNVGQAGLPTVDTFPSSIGQPDMAASPLGGAAGGSYPGPGMTAYPGFDPTLVARANLETETALSFNSTNLEDNPYPSPQPEGTSPSQPTLQVTRVAATLTPTPRLSPTSGVPTGTPTPPSVPTPSAPPPPSVPPPTSAPDLPKEPLPTDTPAPVVPTSPPVDVLRGNARWSISQSPITLHHDVQVATGAELLIEPGVEVRVDPGVSIYVDGARLLVMGLPDQPVRFVGSTRARWSGIFGRPGSLVLMENTQISGAGVGGTMMAVDGSELTVRGSRFFDNGGGIILTDTKLEVKDTEIAGNDVPFGAALDASYTLGTTIIFQHNRIGGNRLSDGAPMVRFANQSTFSTLSLDISTNLIRGGTPNLQLLTNGPIEGGVACNTLVNEGLGFGLRTQTLQVNPNGTQPFNLTVRSNIIDNHIPPIIPVYLKYGLGRGATSEVMVDMRNNWWGEASGPYEPDANPQGRGDSVGSNIIFAPWLTEPPPCATNR